MLFCDLLMAAFASAATTGGDGDDEDEGCDTSDERSVCRSSSNPSSDSDTEAVDEADAAAFLLLPARFDDDAVG